MAGSPDSPQPRPSTGRVLLKLSGEALMGDLDYGTDPRMVREIAREVAAVHVRGVEVAVVVGGGNIYRGLAAAAKGMDRATGDYMGMLATVLNALALQDALEKQGTRPACNRRSRFRGRRAIHPAPRGQAPGEGARRDLRGRHRQPVLHDRHGRRAARAEVRAEVILMAKNGVEGVYTADPAKDPTRRVHPRDTHKDVLTRGLQVMDSTALALCMDNNLAIIVFNMADTSNIDRIVSGERVGTSVKK